MKKRTIIFSLMVISLLLVSCSAVDQIRSLFDDEGQTVVEEITQEPTPTTEPTPLQPVVIDSGLLASYEDALTEIYDGVNPSVVSILASGERGGSQGSGFVWDLEGHIITNNHVVAGANRILVEFFDGTIVDAVMIGGDVYSDLAVLQVEISDDFLLPVQVADSDTVRVGELAIAIGNPFALENTMTVGIVSALGRTIPAGQTSPFGPSYSIPDVIQTDAPINPGNSGGVLVNDQGQVIGVTAAIESPSRANAGIGFVIPSNIVSRVVPVLIEEGEFEHPYLGLTGTRLTPDLAEAMGLEPEQRGAVVLAVTEGGPADEAGLQGSDRQVQVNGQQVPVGGDVIIAIEDETVQDMDDLIAYLFSHTEVGQEIPLTILRDGEQMQVNVELAARPAAEEAPQTVQTEGNAYLGVSGFTLTPPLAELLDLPEEASGVLVVEVRENSPAEEAGLRGGTEPVEIQGEEIMAGGDIITAFDGQPVRSIQELVVYISLSGPGEEVDLTILRDGEEMEITAVLRERPQE